MAIGANCGQLLRILRRPQSEWVTAWAASMQGPYPYGFALLQPDLSLVFPAPERGAADQSFRMIVRPDLWGHAARIRLSNVFGAMPVRFDGVYIGLQFESSAVAAGTNRPVTFGGRVSIVIAPASTMAPLTSSALIGSRRKRSPTWKQPLNARVSRQDRVASQIGVAAAPHKASCHGDRRRRMPAYL